MEFGSVRRINAVVRWYVEGNEDILQDSTTILRKVRVLNDCNYTVESVGSSPYMVNLSSFQVYHPKELGIADKNSSTMSICHYFPP